MNEWDIEVETIKQEIIKGNGEILSENYSKDFDAYISANYPWVSVTGYRIWWKSVRSKKFTSLFNVHNFFCIYFIIKK